MISVLPEKSLQLSSDPWIVIVYLDILWDNPNLINGVKDNDHLFPWISRLSRISAFIHGL